MSDDLLRRLGKLAEKRGRPALVQAPEMGVALGQRHPMAHAVEEVAVACAVHADDGDRRAVGRGALFSEIVIFDSEAIWKIYGMNIWRRQSQLSTKSRLYRLFVMLPMRRCPLRYARYRLTTRPLCTSAERSHEPARSVGKFEVWCCGCAAKNCRKSAIDP
jgi:hypothetical protein